MAQPPTARTISVSSANVPSSRTVAGGRTRCGGDPAPPAEDLLADPDGRAGCRAGLALVADQGQPAVEELARLVASPGHECVADGLERLRIREACHGPVGAARELLEEVDAAQAAEDGHAIGKEL